MYTRVGVEPRVANEFRTKHSRSSCSRKMTTMVGESAENSGCRPIKMSADPIGPVGLDYAMRRDAANIILDAFFPRDTVQGERRDNLLNFTRARDKACHRQIRPCTLARANPSKIICAVRARRAGDCRKLRPSFPVQPKIIS